MEPEHVHPDLLKKLNPKRGVLCAHLNTNGMYRKMEEIKLLLKETKLDIFAVTETHLHKNIHDVELHIDNYSFVRKDRQGNNNNYGGVLVYVRDTLQYHHIEM